MHILKFTQETGLPTNYFLYETIGFNEVGIPQRLALQVDETIGFGDYIPEGIVEILYETIGFNEGETVGLNITLNETIGFNDSADERLKVFLEETIGFMEAMPWELGNITLYETIGFSDGGYSERTLPEHDIIFTWRTRTNANPKYGYGADMYGDGTTYGNGNASNLSTFEIQLWTFDGPDTNRWLNSAPAGEFNERIVKQVITITDTGDPDADATYTLTIAANKAYNGGVFLQDIEAEIFVKDTSGVYSFPKIIKTDSDKIYFED